MRRIKEIRDVLANNSDKEIMNTVVGKRGKFSKANPYNKTTHALFTSHGEVLENPNQLNSYIGYLQEKEQQTDKELYVVPADIHF